MIEMEQAISTMLGSAATYYSQDIPELAATSIAIYFAWQARAKKGSGMWASVASWFKKSSTASAAK